MASAISPRAKPIGLNACGVLLLLGVLAAAPAASADTPELGVSPEIGLDLDRDTDLRLLAVSDVQRYRMMDIEDLMREQVTTVSGVAEEWFRSPASVYVITNDEVRRSGHQTLAESLRLAPGVFVGRSGSSRWMVGTRGFNGALANKTLVLIDGREVYDQLFGGTFWDVQDLLLEDLDRIEVVRGPGPTLWGANAVNGVFNVVSRSAKQTQGFYATALMGTLRQGMGGVRYGGQIDDETWFRVWGKYANYDNFDNVAAAGLPPDRRNEDDWASVRGGFRLDREGPDGGFFTLDANVYTARLGELLVAPVRGGLFAFTTIRTDGRADGGHILARVGQDDRANDSGWSLQAYYDRTERVIFGGLDVTRDTLDIEFRHHFRPVAWQEIVWGLGARYNMDETRLGPQHELIPSSEELTTLSAFVQDTFTIVPERLFLMLGAKLEHHNYTDLEAQPSGRLWWTPDEHNTLWASISRAVRVPSRLEHDSITAFAYFGAIPIGTFGNPDLGAEVLWAYEAGYRHKFSDDLSVDVSLFYNDYDNLIFLLPAVIGPFGTGEAESYGGELSVTWRVAPNWRVQAGYSFTDVQVHDLFTQDEGNTPHHMAQIRSYYDITKDLELNAALYYVDNVAAQGNASYLRLDVGVTWRVTDQFEIAAWGQNLLDPRHSEFTDPLHPGNPAEVPRSFYIQATLRF